MKRFLVLIWLVLLAAVGCAAPAVENPTAATSDKPEIVVYKSAT